MAKSKPLTFAAARSRLDAILAELEDDAVDVDQLAERVREASGLIRLCRERLASARHEVTKVVAELSAEVAEGEAAEGQGPEGQGPEGSGDPD